MLSKPRFGSVVVASSRPSSNSCWVASSPWHHFRCMGQWPATAPHIHPVIGKNIPGASLKLPWAYHRLNHTPTVIPDVLHFHGLVCNILCFCPHHTGLLMQAYRFNPFTPQGLWCHFLNCNKRFIFGYICTNDQFVRLYDLEQLYRDITPPSCGHYLYSALICVFLLNISA